MDRLRGAARPREGPACGIPGQRLLGPPPRRLIGPGLRSRQQRRRSRSQGWHSARQKAWENLRRVAACRTDRARHAAWPTPFFKAQRKASPHLPRFQWAYQPRDMAGAATAEGEMRQVALAAWHCAGSTPLALGAGSPASRALACQSCSARVSGRCACPKTVNGRVADAWTPSQIGIVLALGRHLGVPAIGDAWAGRRLPDLMRRTAPKGLDAND